MSKACPCQCLLYSFLNHQLDNMQAGLFLDVPDDLPGKRGPQGHFATIIQGLIVSNGRGKLEARRVFSGTLVASELNSEATQSCFSCDAVISVLEMGLIRWTNKCKCGEVSFRSFKPMIKLGAYQEFSWGPANRRKVSQWRNSEFFLTVLCFEMILSQTQCPASCLCSLDASRLSYVPVAKLPVAKWPMPSACCQVPWCQVACCQVACFQVACCQVWVPSVPDWSCK